jgi:hypothetical protein
LRFEYSWRWFAFHAAQRTSMFNYFVAIMVGLSVSYAYLIAREREPFWFEAACVAGVGALVSLAFIFLDSRNRDLVHRAERILKTLERREIFPEEQKLPDFHGLLLRDTGMDTLSWSEGPCGGLVRHNFLIKFIQVIILIVFIAAAMSAVRFSLQVQPDSGHPPEKETHRGASARSSLESRRIAISC